MKNSSATMIVLLCLLYSTALANDINGRIIHLSQDHFHHSVLLQINSNFNSTKMGGATLVINFDPFFLNFPDEPEQGADYFFHNFTGGVYDTATITKVFGNQVWINISLDSDGNGTRLEEPDNWTDLVTIQFEKLEPIVNDVITWVPASIFWIVYEDDNTTMLQLGDFNNTAIISTTEDGVYQIDDFNLSQNYPNPFNPTTRINYQISVAGLVSLRVYNLLGEVMETLVNEEKSAGNYNVEFNASRLPSGTYFYRLKVGSFIETKKMVLMK
jgi:hypothetical protein